MAHDIARAVPEPALEPAAPGVTLPAPREALDPDLARPAREREPKDVARPGPRSAHGSRAGWIVLTLAATAAAWGVGWLTGVSWAWRGMTPRYLRRRRVVLRP
jgi:hypothetical protein